jgi:hypothetical protein
VRRHGGQAQGGAQADAVEARRRGLPSRQGELPVCLRERSPCPPASSPAPSAN